MEQQILNNIFAHLNSGNFKKAHKILKTLKKDHKNEAQYWETLALTYGMSGDNKECKNSCLQAIKLNPDNIGTYINLGVAQQNLGSLDDAENSLKIALSINKDHPQVHNNLGSIYILQSDFSKAQPFIEKAISLDSTYSDAHCNLGEIFKNTGSTDKSIDSYLTSLKYNPNNINAYFGLGSYYTYEANQEKAEYYLNTTLQLNPYHIEATFHLGFLHYLLKSYDTATSYFKKTIELEPNHYYASYLLSAITGQDSPEKSPEPYVKGLFDHYASTFDEHLVKHLKYNVPSTMLSIFNKFSQPKQTVNLLDLGCGTGICGEKFAHMYTHMTGVDLSENMIKKTQEKNIYSSLHASDIDHFINNTTSKYDLVIAADVFIYVGNIRLLVKDIYDTMNFDGYFIFSIELSDSDDYFLQNTGRYAHSESHIHEILENASFNIINYQATIIRNEKDNEIKGIIYLCKK